MRGVDLIDVGSLVRRPVNATGFVNLIKAMDNKSLTCVVDVVYSQRVRVLSRKTRLSTDDEGLLRPRCIYTRRAPQRCGNRRVCGFSQKAEELPGLDRWRRSACAAFSTLRFIS